MRSVTWRVVAAVVGCGAEWTLLFRGRGPQAWVVLKNSKPVSSGGRTTVRDAINHFAALTGGAS